MQKIKQIIIATVVLIMLGLTISVLYTKYKNAISERDRIQTNLEYYQTKSSKEGAANIVLQQTVNELSASKDSLIQKIDSLRKELKLKPKTVQTVVYTQTVIRDTLTDTIPITLNFEATVTPNSQTSIKVIRKDSSLTVIPDIRNEQTIFVYTETKYRYKYWISRLFHLNFKKTRTNKYIIENSNSLIKTGESRIVNIVN